MKGCSSSLLVIVERIVLGSPCSQRSRRQMGAAASAVNSSLNNIAQLGKGMVAPIDSKAILAAYDDTSAPVAQMEAAQELADYLQQTHDEDLIYQLCCKHVPGWEAGKTEKTSFKLLSGCLNTASLHEVKVNSASTLLPDAPECVVFSILIVHGTPNMDLTWWSKGGVQQHRRLSDPTSLIAANANEEDMVSVMEMETETDTSLLVPVAVESAVPPPF